MNNPVLLNEKVRVLVFINYRVIRRRFTDAVCSLDNLRFK